ncbi:MAG: lantibiotic dehydratase [Saprospiraceae bacterium]
MANSNIRVFPLSMMRISAAPKSALLPRLPDYAAQLALRRKAEKTLATARAKLLRAFDQSLDETPAGAMRTRLYNARKDFFSKSKMPPRDLANDTGRRDLGKAIKAFRLALDKRNALIDMSDQLVQEGMVAAVRAMQAFAQDATLRASLPYFSRNLLAALPEFVQADPSILNKKTRHTALAVWQLAARMCARNTPLAHFAGVRLVDLEADPVADAEGPALNKVSVSPNAAILELLYEMLNWRLDYIRRLKMQLNPTAYKSPPIWLGVFDGVEYLAEAQAGDEYSVAAGLLDSSPAQFDALCADLPTAAADREYFTELLWKMTFCQLAEWQWPVSGLTPDWAYRLYKFIGEGPADDYLIALAQWLQWLHQAARTLPYRSPEEVCRIQDEAIAGLRTLLAQNEDAEKPLEMPSIPPEHFFYTDTCAEQNAPMPDRRAIREAAANLYARYMSRPDKPASDLRQKLLAYWRRRFKSREQALPYMEFLQGYLSNRSVKPKWLPIPPDDRLGRNRNLVGALITPFTDSAGRQRYVVEAMHPGGGRLFARWLHLFNPQDTEKVRDWIRSNGDWHALSAQSWTNANYQPQLCDKILGVHGGRMFDNGDPGRYVRLSALAVYRRHGELGFFDMTTMRAVHVLDLGLEAVAERPASVKVTLAIGAPYVSRGQMYPSEAKTAAVRKPRVEAGEFIFRRASWTLRPAQYTAWAADKSTNATRFYKLLEALKKLSIPRFAEAHWENKPDETLFFDFHNPLSALGFLGELRKGKGRAITLVEHPAFEALDERQRLYSMAVEMSDGP